MAGALVAPALTSCYDDQPLWDKLNSLEAKVDSLVNDLNSQAEALSALMTDGSTIASCTKNDDGSYLVKLSDGTEFTVLSKNADASALVSFVEENGVRYWATYGADGELVTLKDAAGKAIPVEMSVSVTIKDGKYCLVIGGKEYVTGYDAEDVVSVFSSCTPHTDASGQVYAMTFTFGDGHKVTVTVDGYKGVIFKMANAASTSAVAEYYVDFGATQSFLMDMEDVVDYVMQIPDGWRVKEYVDELTGDTYVDITAPAEETIAANAAVPSGDLKVVSVVEGGKAAVSKLFLSTDPFKVYNVSSAKAVIEPVFGLQKFAYGLIDATAFDRTALVQQLNAFLASASTLPAGYNISESAIDATYDEILGSEMSEDGNYIFWVAPVLYDEGTEGSDASFYVTDEMLRVHMLSPISASITVNETTVVDADVTVRVKGTFSMYGGTMPKSDSALEEIVYMINNGAFTPVTESLVYNGPASEFPVKEDAVELEPNTSYITWVVPVEKDKTTYTATDVIYKEFKTKEVVSGGSIAVTIGEFTTDCSTISAAVTAEGAAMIYYAYLPDSEAKRIENADNDTKMSKIKAASNFTVLRGASAEATVEFVKPETTMWLYAVAVGNDGKYGTVSSKSATTKGVTFNSLAVSVEELDVTAQDAKFKVTVSGGTATDFIYWCGKITDPFWLYEEYCDDSQTGAEIYMAANPDAEAITAVMRKNGQIAQDGTITVTDLDMDATYVFVVLAKDASGNYSHCGYKKFETLAINLGNLVDSDSDTWKSTKQWIESNIVWDKDRFEMSAGGGQGFATFAFDVKIPTELTAYISCFSTVSTELADMILEQVESCGKRRDVSLVTDDPEGLEWVDDRGKTHDAALFFNVCDHYVHGSPDYGYVTFFSSAGHTEDVCPTWESGSCSNLAYAQQKIAEKLSVDHWKEWIVENCNYSYLGDPNHEYSYALTDETKINALAQAWVDAYTPYYKDKEPILYVNEGQSLRMLNRNAMGLDENGNVIDKVVIVLKDQAGNYYEPMTIDVPNYFK